MRKYVKAASGVKAKSGFTLIEVLVAMAIFTFGALAIVKLQATTAQGNADARRLNEASKLAREMMEEFGLLRSYYLPEGADVCESKYFNLSNSDNTPIIDALKDPESVDAGQADPLCPDSAIPEDVWTLEPYLSDMTNTNATIADLADKCLPSPGNCAPVSSFMEFAPGDGTDIYWVAWNLRAGFPERRQDMQDGKQKLVSVKLYVFWTGMGEWLDEDGNRHPGVRHWVEVNGLINAKLLKFYY